MKSPIVLLATALIAGLPLCGEAQQAKHTNVSITNQRAGATPFINNLTLEFSDMRHIRRIRFRIQPKPGSVTRPITGVYPRAYLRSRGYVDVLNRKITVPVFGLYDGYNNTVDVLCFFDDGSFKKLRASIPTAVFDDPCDFDKPFVRQARTTTKDLSYDYILAASSCGPNSPTIIDTDGAVRWVGTAGVQQYYTAFFNNGVYLADGTKLLRMELDGAVSVIRDYADRGDIVGFHHNIDPGKTGLIVDVNTTDYIASVHLEVDATTGEVLKEWNLAQIVHDTMVAGGDNPREFVRMANGRYDFQAVEDWTHNNAVTYRASDNSIIISSRENFVICLDYDTGAIRWILGDTTKRWYQYPSLKKLALTLTSGLPPIGQHSVSITTDDHLLLFDNGQQSAHHIPVGARRDYAAARKYKLDPKAKTATQVWNFNNNFSIISRFRSSVYEDAASNYLVTYARAENPNGSFRAQLVGLTAAREKVFDYSYPTATCCNEAYRAMPIHLERVVFSPPVAPAPTQAASASKQ